MYNQNKYYSEILQGVKCIEIPFIWSPMSIKFTQKILNLPDDSSLLYKQKESKIGIFEPNISLMKWALPCVLIAENTYKTNKNINHVYITNLNKNKDSDINCFNMDQFNNICRGLELFKDKKITSESRYNTLEFMSKHCDIAISHQWENPLNYLYLDHTLIDATIIVPYGCKIEYIQPGRNILKELKTLYSEDAILTLRKYKHFFNLYLKNSF